MAAAADEGPPTLPAPLIQLLGPLFRDGSADSSFGIGRGPLLAPYKPPNCDGSLERAANNNGRPSSVRCIVTHLLGCAPFVVMAVMSESSSSRFSFSFFTSDSIARLEKPSLSPPCRWHISEWTMLRQASALVGAAVGIAAMSRTTERKERRAGFSLGTAECVCEWEHMITTTNQQSSPHASYNIVMRNSLLAGAGSGDAVLEDIPSSELLLRDGVGDVAYFIPAALCVSPSVSFLLLR
uniref:Uncharacterized protein n=1 Tax=Anopheles coluzzii TaxID=1518534 RepID=A0A8W7PUK5_ANOCL